MNPNHRDIRTSLGFSGTLHVAVVYQGHCGHHGRPLTACDYAIRMVAALDRAESQHSVSVPDPDLDTASPITAALLFATVLCSIPAKSLEYITVGGAEAYREMGTMFLQVSGCCFHHGPARRHDMGQGCSDLAVLEVQQSSQTVISSDS